MYETAKDQPSACGEEYDLTACPKTLELVLAVRSSRRSAASRAGGHILLESSTVREILHSVFELWVQGRRFKAPKCMPEPCRMSC